MKKKFIPIALLAGVFAAAVMAAPKGDAVLMTINGKDVKVREFMYLFDKNNQQQQSPQSVDDYVDMFVNYKLKVADAEAAGLDTTASFVKEFDTYRNELAAPYMKDADVERAFIDTIYTRMGRNVDVSHILLAPAGSAAEQAQVIARLDSIRTAILNGADWGEMALKYSIDPSVVQNKGHLGFITANTWPYKFEEVAFSTPVGTISQPFADGGYGSHILRVEGERPDVGEVRAAHILISSRHRGGAEDSIAKATADSLYRLLIAGNDFTTIARANSQDPGSAQQGGDLGYFGPGRMVKPFEDATFALKDGEISEPFRSQFGWHIVKRIDTRHIGSPEDAADRVRQAIQRDPERANVLSRMQHDVNRKKYNVVVDPLAERRIDAVIAKHNGIDSAAVAELAASKIKLATINRKDVVTAADLVNALPPVNGHIDANVAMPTIHRVMERTIDSAVDDYVRRNLAVDNADYRNLLNEYRDGILLFDISNSKVWDRSSKDTEGLEEYFRNHRDNYTWTAPRFKGYIVMSPNDSISEVAKAYVANHEIGVDSLLKVLRANVSRDINMSRVIAAKGENAIVDHVVFGGPRPDDADRTRWKAWFAYDGRLIDQPEEAIDVRAAVTSDYQKWLEEQWIAELRSKYPVKINPKVLKGLKK